MNKPIYYYDIQQNTPEWMNLRCGKFTASVFSNLLSKKTTATYQNTINKVVFEITTGESPEGFSNEWTERGHLLEPEAIEHYKFVTFNDVQRVGFVELNKWIGCSPDGLVGDEGMVQIKCPKYSTLIDYLIKDKVPSDYYTQIQGELMVTQREWSDFFVYHPHLKSMIKRINRDEEKIKEIQTEIDIAIAEVEKRLEQLKTLVR